MVRRVLVPLSNSRVTKPYLVPPLFSDVEEYWIRFSLRLYPRVLSPTPNFEVGVGFPPPGRLDSSSSEYTSPFSRVSSFLTGVAEVEGTFFFSDVKNF